MKRVGRHALAAAGIAATAAQAAIAAPGNSSTFTGTAEAIVLERFRIINDDDLRFGQFLKPTAAGTLIIAPGGAASATGGVVPNYTIAQTSGGRGPATFHMLGKPNRAAVVNLPNKINISNGSATMEVRNFTRNGPNGVVSLDTLGYFKLYVGATLIVGANQAFGTYTGTFDVTVHYN